MHEKRRAFADTLKLHVVTAATGNEFLNRMADMAGLLNCQSCTDMACAMRTPLPGQLVTNLVGAFTVAASAVQRRMWVMAAGRSCCC